MDPKELPLRVIGVVASVTVVTTAGLVGLVALISGDTAGVNGRFPYYVLATAVAFVVILYKLDDESIDGPTVLIASSGIAIAVGILFSLAVEGVRFGLIHPDELVASQLIIYFVAASLICTGLGMWSLKHWREFTSYQGSSDSGL